MLIDMAHAVGGYLHGRFRHQAGLVGDPWIRRPGLVHDALRRAVDRLRARRAQRHSDWRSGVSRSAAACCCSSMRCIARTRCSSPARRSASSSICAIFISSCATSKATQRASEQIITPRRRARQSRAQDRRSDPRPPQARYGSAPSARRAPSVSRCATACNRTGWPGSHSRPTMRRCRTAPGYRERRR